jgi:hypothetical protein
MTKITDYLIAIGLAGIAIGTFIKGITTGHLEAFLAGMFTIVYTILCGAWIDRLTKKYVCSGRSHR